MTTPEDPQADKSAGSVSLTPTKEVAFVTAFLQQEIEKAFPGSRPRISYDMTEPMFNVLFDGKDTTVDMERLMPFCDNILQPIFPKALVDVHFDHTMRDDFEPGFMVHGRTARQLKDDIFAHDPLFLPPTALKM